MNNNDRIVYNVIKKYQIFSEKDLEAYVHALIDIKESVSKITGLLLEVDDKKNKEEVLDIIWEIREEFRHIDYHIKDAKLTE
ncbi:MAG: hypothetical protein RBS38_06510 [Bacteroidales bacterium]|jgi:hypothetical protein|nr:hypothetical protein [Bacteroidales bacterium]